MERIELLEQALGDRLPPEGLDRFIDYRSLILDWNRNLHLVSKRDEALLISRHFLESVGLAVVLDITNEAKVMDLGSGPGFPGIPLAIIRPDLDIVLVESVAKRAEFLKHAVGLLGLKQVDVLQARAETSHENRRDRDWVFSRAVADCDTLMKWSKGWIRSGGRLVAFKGADILEELKRLERNAAKRGVKDWKVIPYDPFPNLMPFQGKLVAIVAT